MKSIPHQLNLFYSTRKKRDSLTSVELTCESCGKTFTRYKANIKCKKQYCSQQCAGVPKRKEFAQLNGKAGVYEIVHTPTGRCYIGASRNLQKRREDHFCQLKVGDHKNVPLQKAYNQDGLASLTFHVLEFVEDISVLSVREQYWIDQVPAHLRFNISSFVTTKGVKASPELSTRLSQQRKGRPPTNNKLDATQAKEIKRRLANGERGVDLAQEFNVAQVTISAIKHGRLWARIT